jgi:O-antigen/teichoic acid export membrane protein
MWILTPGGVFLICDQVMANLLNGLPRQLAAAWAQRVALIITPVLLGILIPSIGAAITSTVPYGVSLALMLRSLRALHGETSKGASCTLKTIRLGICLDHGDPGKHSSKGGEAVKANQVDPGW